LAYREHMRSSLQNVRSDGVRGVFSLDTDDHCVTVS
jgi:hypothetical protein